MKNQRLSLSIKLSALSIAALLLAACAKPPAPKLVKLPGPNKNAYLLKLPEAHKIVAQGNIRMKFVANKAGKKTTKVLEYTSNRQWVTAKVHNKTLYLTENKAALNPNYAPAVLEIHTAALKSLATSGPTTFTASNVKSKDLSLRSDSNAKIKLRGTMSLSKLSTYGASDVDIQWLNSKLLVIDAHDRSQIHLAGVADNVRAKLYDSAQLGAKYLRINNALVQTNENSAAKVLVKNNLRAFANENSNIYYYHNPKHLTRHTTDTANVLQIAWRK